jgi:hypothetical protein
VGAGGEIRLRGAAANEQRSRLKLEGVRFIGKRVDMERFEHALTRIIREGERSEGLLCYKHVV